MANEIMKEARKDFAKNFISMQMKKNMTVEELMKGLKVSRQMISNYRTGKAFPTFQRIQKLTDIFGCSIEDLLGGSEQHG